MTSLKTSNSNNPLSSTTTMILIIFLYIFMKLSQTNLQQINIILMGNYVNIPKRPPLKFNPKIDQFQSLYVQRIKQTPFINAQVYSLQPALFIDNIDIRMSQLVKPRMVSRQFFPPTQIIKIIQNIVMGLNQLQQHNYEGHGNLSFETIYYNKLNRIFKITHPLLNIQSGYQLMKLRKLFCFLSPQQLLQITDPKSNCHNLVSFQSDLFVFGIIMLQVCTLLPSNQIYCPDTCNIFNKQIQNRFQIIKQCYQRQPKICQLIINILKNMVQYDQANRKTCKQILQQICQSGLTTIEQNPPNNPLIRPQNVIPPGKFITKEEMLGPNIIQR